MNDADLRLRRRAVLLLLLANVYWGLSFPLIKAITALNHLLVPAAGTWYLAAAALAPRFLLAVVIMLVFQRAALVRPSRRELEQGLGIAAFAAAGSLLQTDGLQFTAATTSCFLTQFTAIVIPTWLAVRHRRNPGVAVWTACVLVLAGAAILGRMDPRTLRMGRGEVETVFCAFFFAAQILWLDRSAFAGNRAGVTTLIMFAAEAAIFSVMGVVTAPRTEALLTPWRSVPWLGLTLTLAAVCTVGAFTIMNRWQPRISPTQAGLIYAIEPLFASLFALFAPGLFSAWGGIDYPNERATWTLALGGGLITVANILAPLGARRAPAEPEPA
jgi:drug/metabolite transporter (DMT)-like permease